ncbi:ATP-dependent DNA ligase [Candidatus Woesearchaeota archaeon]|jgi:DNA ligase 1|nr:ATP-dependent DNA ligase [Candidatus Woesearchaeota archaeon]MBT4368045.1 ATP-dependent DNA ligase [Candidatus Woesearchaeota archaeon]MBT4712533.1 ATP-dependent DNA ligase [Candidatus Woesearchaeota archaeon]MBT6639446.1 ATP-dependent DNA ligase [Candidatus Woesearchaeota archaeon]MBT7133618.1 ATP-dependent DNA ligase [Candidatus Woesearchaeota archaeon]
MHYEKLVETYEKLESTSKRLDKTHYVSELLKSTTDDMEEITLLLQGKVFPSYDERKIGMASKLVLKALNIATGTDADQIMKSWKKTGDLGNSAAELIKEKSQKTLFQTNLSVSKVFTNIQKVALIEGQGTVDKKLKLIAELLTSAKPLEAKYIIRTVLEDLRVGVGDGTLRDAITLAFLDIPETIFSKCPRCQKLMPKIASCLYCTEDLPKIKESGEDRVKYNLLLEAVQNAYDMTNDFGQVATIAKTKGLSGLQNIQLSPETPIKVMLYQKAKGWEDAFERVGTPAAVEYKYDGFRVQAHGKDGNVKLFTRRLEEVTKQFPEVINWIKQDIQSNDFIIDGEIIGISKQGKFLPFQNISQRIKRKHEIEKMVKDLPVVVRWFDLMELEGKNYLKEPYSERRNALAGIIKENDNFKAAEQIITDDIATGVTFYEESIAKGNEGVMVKKLDAPYKPGSRVGYGVKIKSTMDPLDLVIVGAEWGKGKRSEWLSSFILACQDENGNMLEMGRVGTGIKEKAEEGTSFGELTKLLEPLILSEENKVVKVKPKIVLSIEYEEIQRSPSYSAGYALRFPRLKEIRIDKPVSEISTLHEVEDLYEEQ